MKHIGKKIEEVVREKRFSVSEFAKLINTNRNNIYSIFRRESVDTELLSKIGEVLEYNFFNYLSSKNADNQKILEMTINENTPIYSKIDNVKQLEDRIKQIENENMFLKQRVEDKEEIIKLLKDQI